MLGLRTFSLLLSLGSTVFLLGQDRYPEGQATPRFLTAEEQAIIAQTPIRAPEGVDQPPSGPLYCPAEFEPMESIMLAYDGSPGWLAILDQMAAAITTTGDADVYVMADSSAEAATIQSNMAAAGADPARVFTIVETTDTIWIRDYGPRYVFEGDVRVIVDHTYNRPRPNDNQIPFHFGEIRGHQRYQIPLVHGGGNYHIDSSGESHTTRLINNENPGLTEQEIHDLWLAYQTVDTTFYTPFPTFIDATQHIDMWMQMIGENTVVISDWPFDAGSVQDQICDQAAVDLAQKGYTIHRIPARSTGGTHYTYTNVVMCNNLVLAPTYTNSQVVQHNDEALQIWQEALPGHTIVAVDCQAIVTAAGVMHCISMHVPKHRGGQNPTAYLKTRFEDAPVLTAGQQYTLQWISDDDVAVAGVDLALSTDGGLSFNTLIAENQSGLGSLSWTVPDVFTTSALIRVTAFDDDANEGQDSSETLFMINGPRSCVADCAPENGDGSFGDGVVDGLDLAAIRSLWLTRGYGVYDTAPPLGNQVYGDGWVDIRDLVQVVSSLGNCL